MMWARRKVTRDFGSVLFSSKRSHWPVSGKGLAELKIGT